jgi:outer membrane protein OmpA-like peptidoglycan-associated protein
LIDNQQGDGGWERYHRSYAFDSTGDRSEATAYALLALNATGMDNTNATITAGANYLTGIYQEDGSWGKPQNLGYPLNTEANEAALFIATKGNYGYFASDKLEGYGGYDIYRFDLWEEIKPEPIGFVMIRIFDKDTREQLDADFEMVHLETGETLLNSDCNEYLKDYFFLPLPLYNEYALNVNRPGYLFHSANFNLTEADKFQIREVDIFLEKIKTGRKLVMENVFFATDSFELKEKSIPELNQLAQLLKDNPDLKIEIGGHTDSTGSSAYNQQLAEKRAKSVYQFLVEKAISPDRLTYKGYGDSEPIATNQTEEGKAKNRRTEVKVVGE